MVRSTSTIKLICPISSLALPLAAGAAYWYGGDFDSRNGAPNEVTTFVGASKVYEDFTVGGSGIRVTEAWSNNLTDALVASTAQVEIRTGVGVGIPGTVVFSGTLPASLTDTGRSGLNLVEKEVRVTGLSVFLAPGSYHLSVAPVGNGSGRSFASSTGGANGVGTPLHNGNSFVDSSELGYNFSTASYLGSGTWDFSMGLSAQLFFEVPPANLTVVRGVATGGVNELSVSDDNRLSIRPGVVLTSAQAPAVIEVGATAPVGTVAELRFSTESRGSMGGLRQVVMLYNYQTQQFDTLSDAVMSTSDAEVIVTASTAPSYVEAGTRAIKSRLEFRAAGPVLVYPWTAEIDKLAWLLFVG
jgi:hypothetical protein